MSIRTSTHQKKVRSTRKRLEEVRALRILTRLHNHDDQQSHVEHLDAVGHLTNRELDGLETELKAEIEQYTSVLKPTRPLTFYVDFLQSIEIGSQQLLFLPKWKLKLFFQGIEAFLTGIDLLPEHTLLSCDIHGIYPKGTPGEIRILEAALFEDMCALYNHALDISPAALAPNAPKSVIKTVAASRRGSVLAAFYMVEAYLNSIAFDYLIAHSHQWPTAELEQITEWDDKRNRQRLVSFRDKLLGYPRIILGLKHPPLQENNCPEVRFLLEESKLFRDAVVHANPRPDPNESYSSKELAFWRIASLTGVTLSSTATDREPDDDVFSLEKTIDAAIEVVRLIERTIHGDTRRLFWVHSRQANGRFDDVVFE